MHSSDGGLGRQPRRHAFGPHAATLAKFWAQRRKLIWGGEAAAVQPDGRANPNQTMATECRRGLRQLLDVRASTARDSAKTTICSSACSSLTRAGSAGRTAELEPRIAYHHPLLDAKFDIDGRDSVVCSDDDFEASDRSAMWRRHDWL